MKILIIQQKRIGDVLTSSILANSLKNKYPNAIIDYMCYANCVDVLKENKAIANIVVLENEVRKNYLSLFKFILKIGFVILRPRRKRLQVVCCVNVRTNYK